MFVNSACEDPASADDARPSSALGNGPLSIWLRLVDCCLHLALTLTQLPSTNPAIMFRLSIQAPLLLDYDTSAC